MSFKEDKMASLHLFLQNVEKIATEKILPSTVGQLYVNQIHVKKIMLSSLSFLYLHWPRKTLQKNLGISNMWPDIRKNTTETPIPRWPQIAIERANPFSIHCYESKGQEVGITNLYDKAMCTCCLMYILNYFCP